MTATREEEMEQCEACEHPLTHSPVPGVLWPVVTNSDSTHLWVARCDTCQRYEDDFAAAIALANHLDKWGVSHTEGTTEPIDASPSPFIDLLEG